MSKLLPFIIISLISALLTLMLKTFVITDTIYFNSLAEQLSREQIADFIETSKSWEWLAYLLIPVIFLVKCLMISLCICTGMFLLSNRFDFSKVLEIVIISDFIFLIPLAIKLLWFLYIQESYSLQEVQYFTPLSMLSFFDIKTLETWLIYPLQTLNIFEILYWVLLSYLISLRFPDLNMDESMEIIACSYCTSLTVWVGVVMFLSLMLVN